MTWLWKLINRRDEHGAILIMAAAGMVLAIVSSALAVDLGRQAVEKRNDQKVADLAALDAIRDIPNRQTLAVQSAARNGFTHNGTTHTVSAIEGNLSGGNCVAAAGSESVCVTVTSPHENKFLPGSRTVTARAVAKKQNLAGFTIGSGVANVDTKKSILDGTLGDMLNGTVSIASYQGLANTTVSLEALQTQLLTLGLPVGTPDQLLDADMSIAQLFYATGNALVLGGDTVNGAVFCKNTLALTVVNCDGTSLAARAAVGGTLKLRDLLSVAAGSQSAVLASQFNVFQLLTGSAAVINGNNLVAIPGVNLNILGVSNTTGSLTLIEKPRGYFGPVGVLTDPAHVTTGQADLTVSTSLNVLGTVTGTVSIRVTAGTASGWLTEVNCANSPRYTMVHADAHAATVIPTISLSIAGVPLSTSLTSSAAGNDDDLQFNYPLYPNPSNPAQQQVGTSSLNLNATVSGGNILQQATILLLGPILNQVVDALDNLVIQPTLDALGISMANADVKGLDPIFCGSPTLAG